MAAAAIATPSGRAVRLPLSTPGTPETPGTPASPAQPTPGHTTYGASVSGLFSRSASSGPQPLLPSPPSDDALSPLAQTTIWESDGMASVWQRLAAACLLIVALTCVHHLLFSLRTIFVPFFLSGFIVFALQPSVEFAFQLLAGLAPPYRWCLCCCKRGGKARERQDVGRLCGSCWVRMPRDEEALLEQEPLLERLPTLTEMVCEAVCRFLAVTLAIIVIFCIFSLFLGLLGNAAVHMKEHWKDYDRGLHKQQKRIDNYLKSVSAEMGTGMETHLKDAYDEMLGEANNLVWQVAELIIHGVSEGISQLLMVLLYVLFWLMQPLPIGGKASSVVRSYLWKKSLVSFLYGVCVALLFLALGVDLAVFFGVVSFCLNYVPEVGAFISMILPMPVILLDGRLEYPISILLVATFGQLLLKFIIGNILEVKLIERDREMNIHPVWIILGLTYFGYMWGPLGALMSVPMLAMVKTAALDFRGDPEEDIDSLVPALAEAFLACFEGRVPVWVSDPSRVRTLSSVEKRTISERTRAKETGDSGDC